MSIHPLRPNAEMAAACFATVEAMTKDQQYPLGTRPLLAISTRNETPGYQRLQARLAQLSRNNKLMVAGNSTHMVIIDQPELIVNAIREVVEAVRHGTALK
jgi:pimeloyl-ACP methyl ester carboxylesterase